MSRRILSLAVLAGMAAAAAPASAVSLDGRGSMADLNEPWLPSRRSSSRTRIGWVKAGDCPKHRSKAERNKRKAARRARARNAKR